MATSEDSLPWSPWVDLIYRRCDSFWEQNYFAIFWCTGSVVILLPAQDKFQDHEVKSNSEFIGTKEGFALGKKSGA